MTPNLGFDQSDTPLVLSLATLNPLWPRFSLDVPRKYKRQWRCLSFDLLNFPTYRRADAPALVSKAAWLTVGGYDCTVQEGQEISDFGLKFAKRGLVGAQVACGPYG